MPHESSSLASSLYLGSASSSSDHSPGAALGVSVDLSRFSYFSFPETSVTQTPARSNLPSVNIGLDQESGTSTDSHLIPKTFLGRFKYAIGATGWALPASQHSAVTTTSTHSFISASQTPPSFEQDSSHLSRSRNRNSATPNRSIDETFHPTRSSRSSAVNINHATFVTTSGSPIRAGPSASIRIPPHSHFSGPNSMGPLSSTPESPRAQFYIQSQTEATKTSNMVNADIDQYKGFALANPHAPLSHEMPMIPTFSHIPGFPLARETVADDVGSVLSSSIAPSMIYKGGRLSRDDGGQSTGSDQFLSRSQGEGLSKEYWMPDKDAKECYDCAVAFTSWRRKHHCRICGAIFCSRCASNLVPGQRFGSAGYIRVCNICLAKLEPIPDAPPRALGRDDVEDDSSTAEAGSSFHIFGSRSHAPRIATSGGKTSLTPSRHRDQGKSSTQSGLSYSTRRSSISSNSRTRLEHLPTNDASEQYREFARAAMLLPHPHRTTSSTIGTSTPLAHSHAQEDLPFSHSTISSSTAPFRKGINDGDHSGLFDLKLIQPSQRLITPTPSIVRSSFGSRPASSQREPWREQSTGTKQPPLSIKPSRPDFVEHLVPALEHIPPVPSSEEKFDTETSTKRLDDRWSAVLTGALGVRAFLLMSIDSKGPNFPFASYMKMPPVIDSDSMEISTELYLSSASLAHLRAMIRQSLHRERVPKAPVWESELAKLLVKVVTDPPRPDEEESGTLDINKLIKIKKIPGGQPQNSEYVHGVVFSKNVVHKKMRTDCINPRVLAVSIPLEFQRVDGYSKLEPLIRQEKQYLKTLVNRLTSLRPDVLLVEGNVSGLAIEYLVQAGVSVVRHVKPCILQAIARSTQTPVISSLDKLLNLQVGQCDVFHVQTFEHRLIPGQRKSFVRLEGCRPEQGGTLLLRGGSVTLLSQVKALMRIMVRIVYSMRLEHHFLRDEGAIMSPIPEILRKCTMLNLDNAEVQTVIRSFRRARRQLLELKHPASTESPKKCDPREPLSPVSNLGNQIDDILRPYENMVLSGSPNVKLVPPVVLTRLRDVYQQLDTLRRSPKPPQSAAFSQPLDDTDPKEETLDETSITPSTSKPPTLAHSTDGSQTPSACLDISTLTKISAIPAEYTRASLLAGLGRQLSQAKLAAAYHLSTHRSETFHPLDHQRIVVQEAVVCMNTTSGQASYTCQGPQLRSFSYYLSGDQSVGQIVQLMVACQGEMCPAKGCGQHKNLHQTNFIHGQLQASIRIHHPCPGEGAVALPSNGPTPSNKNVQEEEPDPTLEPGNEDLILMQGYCPLCEGHTRKTAMSEDGWRLSFGKYLELCFYSPGVVAEYLIHGPSGLRLPCAHDMHLDHTRFFFYRGFRIDFSLRRINVYEAIPPSLCLTPDSQAQWKVLEEEYCTILKRSDTFFQSVRNRINAFNYDVVAIDKQDASEEAMRELMKKVELDVQMIQLQLDEVHLACVGTNGVKINTVRKTLVDKAVEWDHLFATFELRFVATDSKDARRLTSVQLRKLFIDPTAMPGSPDRLFSRIQQLPPFNPQRYQYASQSEVESDHAGPKTTSPNSIKKSFATPALKSMASALAFALPTSIPSLGLPDNRNEAIAAKTKGAATAEGDTTSKPISPEPPTEHSDDEGNDRTPAVGHVDLKKQQDNGGSLNLNTTMEVSLTSPVTTQSDPFLAKPVAHPGLQVVPAVDDAQAHSENHSERSITTCEPSSSSLVAQSSVDVIKALPVDSLVDASPEATPKRRSKVSYRLRNSSTGDGADGFASDSTIINARDKDRSIKTSPHDRQGQDTSDTDTTNHSEASREDPRRLTIRGRRILEIGPSIKGGVANLVQRFEKPTTKELRIATTVSPAISEAEAHPGDNTQDAPRARKASKAVNVTAAVTRPIFRRGKSEIVRSSTHVFRGKRPVGQTGQSHEGTQSSLKPQPSANSVSERAGVNANPTKIAPRHPLRIHNKRAPSKLGLDGPTRLPKTLADGYRGDSTLGPPPRITARLSKDPGSRRNKPDSGLPISTSYLSRHNQPFSNKVSTMTRHFDRMSREAERQKHGIQNRSRPRPIAHAKSSVHAFSSVTAAVHEDSDSDLDQCSVNPAEHDADDEGDITPDLYRPQTPEAGPSRLELAPLPSMTSFPAQIDTVPHHESPPGGEDESLNRYPDSATLPRPTRPLIAQTTPCSPSFLTDSFRIPPSGLSQFSDNEMSAGEAGRHSIIKTLSSLWSYRGAEFIPLDYPQLPTEHQSAGNPVLIREDEPSSIIAYTLGSQLYQDTLKDTEPRVVERSEVFMPEDVVSRGPDYDSTWGMIDFAPKEMDVDDALKVAPNSAKPMQFRYDVIPCTITCKVFFMHQFEALRKSLGCKDIVESLARCHKWDASGGKSGQNFLKTKDGRYLIKGISKTELEALTKFAPAYFDYLSSASRDRRPITLAKMLGIFQISFVNKITNRKGRLQVQVIENLWAAKPDLQIYDLKGLTRNRTVNVTGRPNEVLLDGNFCEMTRSNPLFVHEDSLLRLQAGLHNDTLFLASNNVMDYSLAIGIDEENQELHVGIIDYLRTYSWDKRLETLVKELGGTSKEAPTVITPSLYKARFRRAMARYFTVSPDAWLRYWKPHLMQSDEDVDRDGVRVTEAGAKAEDHYIQLL